MRMLKYVWIELIFESISKRREFCKSYLDFRFEQNEIDFVKEVVNLLCLFVKIIVFEFDLFVEDVKMLDDL